MLNWEELSHIHVIRKLEQILAQWFDVTILFADETGLVRNYNVLEARKDFKNPLCNILFSREVSRKALFTNVARMSEKLQQSTKPIPVWEGPLGCEKSAAFPIVVEGEYLGCVYAYPFWDKAPGVPEKKAVNSACEDWGLDPKALDSALDAQKTHTVPEHKYMLELVELVAEEIVTFHTEIAKREERIEALNKQLGDRTRYDSMIGKSKPMQEIYSLLDKIRTSDSTVLVLGENGTGKELIARAIHYNSPRKDAPFITVNCSAFNENLLDSELFGHVKGSFTGAIRDKKGLFEAANKGTLLLDEIGDMTLTMQVKLLRVLQEGTLIPVGGTEQRKVDVRVLAATNKDLKGMVERSQFREDLYYRVNVISIQVPPLRDRKEDIPVLLDHFLVKECKEKNVPIKTLAKRAVEKILDYPWPGNVRELENEVERVIVLSGDDDKVSADMLSQRIRDFGGGAKANGVRVTGKLKDALEELERTMIREGLRRTKWNKSRLAKELGISRAGLIMKVEKYSLDKRLVMKKDEKAA